MYLTIITGIYLKGMIKLCFLKLKKNFLLKENNHGQDGFILGGLT